MSTRGVADVVADAGEGARDEQAEHHELALRLLVAARSPLLALLLLDLLPLLLELLLLELPLLELLPLPLLLEPLPLPLELLLLELLLLLPLLELPLLLELLLPLQLELPVLRQRIQKLPRRLKRLFPRLVRARGGIRHRLPGGGGGGGDVLLQNRRLLGEQLVHRIWVVGVFRGRQRRSLRGRRRFLRRAQWR